LSGRRIARHLAGAALFFGLALHAQVSARPSEILLRDARIIREPVNPGGLSGVMAFYVRLDVRTASGRLLTLYWPYMRADQMIPRRGDRCDIAYRFRAISGMDGIRGVRSDRARLVRTLSCRRANRGLR
jgi:hypothetical protein